jgi:hypothetical protein
MRREREREFFFAPVHLNKVMPLRKVLRRYEEDLESGAKRSSVDGAAVVCVLSPWAPCCWKLVETSRTGAQWEG